MTEGDGDGCTRGFMSLDRMDRLLGNIGTQRVFSNNFQVVYPEVGFTCSGSIRSWVFGAQWEGGESFFTELQIWRPTGNGVYTKVGYTTIIVNEPAALYEYPLSLPLAFQAGDVLGYYQPEPSLSQLNLLFIEDGRENQLGYVYFTTGPANSLNISSGFRSIAFQLFVNVVTVKSGDILGIFLPRHVSSRLRLLSENTNSPTQYYQFTDDFATVSPHNMFDIGNQFVITSSYHPLVSVEFVRNPTSSVMILPSPIIIGQSTVESGVLHIFLLKLKLTLTKPTAPTQTGTTGSGGAPSSISSLTPTAPTVASTTGSGVPSSALTIATPTKSTAATESGTTGSEVYIFVGVSGLVVVLIAASLIIISVTVCLRQRSKKKLLINTENVAYGMGLELKDNVAYTSTATGGGTKDDEGNYDYVSRDEVTATSSDLSMSANQAYGLVQS
ncbi:hypothetical protein GBAR_LOCUS30408 [Geodia barretti]|uniref:Uncharacterized protein n=1 Tax=Geodia barretti TaxID=519541 RepID=A0AA35XEF9_GEOBA|nr:hypothetical protein GBAR_LOCUS30408 [Geodia barretti]